MKIYYKPVVNSKIRIQNLILFTDYRSKTHVQLLQLLHCKQQQQQLTATAVVTLPDWFTAIRADSAANLGAMSQLQLFMQPRTGVYIMQNTMRRGALGQNGKCIFIEKKK